MRPWLPADPLQPFFAFSGLENPYPFTLRSPSSLWPKEPPNKQAFPWLRAITGVDQRLTTHPGLWVFFHLEERASLSKSVRGLEIERDQERTFCKKKKKKKRTRRRRRRRRAGHIREPICSKFARSRVPQFWSISSPVPVSFRFPSHRFYTDYIYGGGIYNRGGAQFFDYPRLDSERKGCEISTYALPFCSSRRPSVAWNLSKDGSVSGRRETFGKNKEQVDFRKMVSPCTRNGLTVVTELSVPFFFSFLFCGFKVSCVNIIGIFECDSRWFKFLRLDERDKLILKEISCFSYVSYIFFHRSKLLKWKIQD